MARGRRPPPCPCGNPVFAACCGPLLSGEAPAADAEALMRSRYTAYAHGDRDYLLASWHPRTRPDGVEIDPACKWIGLTVHAHRAIDDDHAEVRFTARYRLGGRAHRLSEHSRFERLDGRWYYLDGRVRED